MNIISVKMYVYGLRIKYIHTQKTGLKEHSTLSCIHQSSSQGPTSLIPLESNMVRLLSIALKEVGTISRAVKGSCFKLVTQLYRESI